LHAVAGQQLAACGVFGTCRLAATDGDFFEMGFEVVHHRAHGSGIGREIGRAWVELGMQNSHRVCP
jgi:hypothetical protein